MPVPQRDQLRGEVAQLQIRIGPVPPGDLVVLAVGVVVALLGPADLVAAEEQRYSPAQQQRREHRPPLPGAQQGDRGIG